MKKRVAKRMPKSSSGGPIAQKSSDTEPKLEFSKQDIEGCFETETAYLVIISTPIGVRYERLYPKANNDESAREAFKNWLNEDDNSVFKKEKYRQCVIVHKQTRILISTRIA